MICRPVGNFRVRYELTNLVPVSPDVSSFVLNGNGHCWKPTCCKELFHYDNFICLCFRNMIEDVGNIRESAKLEQRAKIPGQLSASVFVREEVEAERHN